MESKACANNKKMRKRIAQKEALWFEQELKSEINQDRKDMKRGAFDLEHCKGCGICVKSCPFGAITMEGVK